MKTAAAGLALLLGLSACASAPRIDVVNRGAAPAAGPARTFQLILSNVGERQAELDAAITRRLRQSGLTPVASAPDLWVDAGYSKRPGVVGAYDTAGQSQAAWLDKPVRRRWWQGRAPDQQAVSVVLVNARSGREVYRATATQILPKRDVADMTGLVDAALGGAPAPPQRR